MAMPDTLNDARVLAVLKRLYEIDQRQFKSLVLHYLPRMLWQRLRGRRQVDLDAGFLRDKLVALDANKARYCYLQCRALNAARVVEVGTSYGVSTIYLAAAMRDNAAGGIVIGTEIEAQKAEFARANWAEAGIAEHIDLRVGDALEMLRDCGGAVDFVLIDTWIPLALPALELLVPQLARGAVVVCDNVTQFAHEYRDYLQRVRDPAQGFLSTTLPFKGGLEFSVWNP